LGMIVFPSRRRHTRLSGDWSSDVCSSDLIIPVLKQTDKYVVYDRGYFWRDEAAPRPLGGRPRQVGYKVGEGTYGATEYGLEHVESGRASCRGHVYSADGAGGRVREEVSWS